MLHRSIGIVLSETDLSLPVLHCSSNAAEAVMPDKTELSSDCAIFHDSTPQFQGFEDMKQYDEKLASAYAAEDIIGEETQFQFFKYSQLFPNGTLYETCVWCVAFSPHPLFKHGMKLVPLPQLCEQNLRDEDRF